jgi:hypothetical protein
MPSNLPDATWAAGLPLERVPAALAVLASLSAVLAARMLESHPAASAAELIDAVAMASRLGVAVSNVRAAARTGKIPHVRIGRFIRFDPVAVSRALQGGAL